MKSTVESVPKGMRYLHDALALLTDEHSNSSATNISAVSQPIVHMWRSLFFARPLLLQDTGVASPGSPAALDYAATRCTRRNMAPECCVLYTALHCTLA